MSISAIASYFLTLGVLAFAKHYQLETYALNRVQNSHSGDIPRYGGAAVLAATLGSMPLHYGIEAVNVSEVALLLLFGSFAFGVGFLDDLLGGVSPRARIFLLVIVSFLAGGYLGWLDKVNIDLLDNLVRENIILASLLTLIAVVGLTNSFNLIDGLNGLASGTALIVLGVLTFLSIDLGQDDLSILFSSLFACLLGFFVVNFPFGKIFLGDGGAYFIGFMIAQGCILLNSVVAEISSWVFVLLCIYPISETIVSIFRRIFSRRSWTVADRGHLHQLMYDNLSFKRDARYASRYNSSASIICLMIPAASGLLSILFVRNSLVIQLACLLFLVIYLLLYGWLYFRLIRAVVD